MKCKIPLDDIPFVAVVCVFRTVTGVGVKNALSGVILVKNIRGAYGGISGCDHFS